MDQLVCYASRGRPAGFFRGFCGVRCGLLLHPLGLVNFAFHRVGLPDRWHDPGACRLWLAGRDRRNHSKECVTHLGAASAHRCDPRRQFLDNHEMARRRQLAVSSHIRAHMSVFGLKARHASIGSNTGSASRRVISVSRSVSGKPIIAPVSPARQSALDPPRRTARHRGSG